MPHERKPFFPGLTDQLMGLMAERFAALQFRTPFSTRSHEPPRLFIVKPNSPNYGLPDEPISPSQCV